MRGGGTLYPFSQDQFDRFSGRAYPVATTSCETAPNSRQDTSYTFTWYDTAKVNWTAYYVYFSPGNYGSYGDADLYDWQGNMKSAYVGGGDAHHVNYTLNAQNEIVTRDDTQGGNTINYVHEVHYYFDGIELGDISNNGTSNFDYAQSIADHRAIQGTGDFQNGATTGTAGADFDQSYDAINGMNYQPTASSYTVQAGDTLQSVAYQLWGDSSFWYLIADANGLTSADTLVQGQTLSIPNKVHNVHNNADTYSVYDPNKAQGNLQPIPPKNPSDSGGGGCGFFGEIITFVVAAVVTFFAGPIAGDVAKQLTAMALGEQKSFSWSELGATAGTAILTGIGSIGDPLIDVPVAMARDAIYQGLNMLMGGQKSFSWLDVGLSGVTAGVGDEANIELNSLENSNPDFGSFAANFNTPSGNLFNSAVSGMAGGIASAGIRSLATGTDFGDNLIAVLPSVIGNTIGNGIAGQVDGWINGSDGQAQYAPNATQQITPNVPTDPNKPKTDWIDYTETSWDAKGNGTAATLTYYYWDSATGQDVPYLSQPVASQDMSALTWLSQQFPDSYGTDIAGIASQSPTFIREVNTNLSMMDGRSWHIGFWSSGSLTIQADAKTMLNNSLAGDPTAIVGVLSHEWDHANYTGPIAEDSPNYQGYKQQEELEEGEATAKNIQVDNEIYQNTNGGINVGIGASTPQDALAFQSIYDHYGDTEAAYRAIGNLYPTQRNDFGTYEEGWKKQWNAQHPSNPAPS